MEMAIINIVTVHHWHQYRTRFATAGHVIALFFLYVFVKLLEPHLDPRSLS